MVKSTTRTLDLLETIAGADDGLTHGDLARRLAIPKSSLTEILRDLVERRYVTIGEDTGRIAIGPQTLVLARGFLGRLDVVRELAPLLRELRDQTGEAVTLSLLQGGEVVVVGQESAHGPLSPIMRVGDRAPVMATASGKALAAFLNDSQLSQLLAAEGASVDPARLGEVRQELRRIRAGAIAHADGDLIPGVEVIALPVFGHDAGQPVAALATAFLGIHSSPEKLARLEEALRTSSIEACLRLGHRAR